MKTCAKFVPSLVLLSGVSRTGQNINLSDRTITISVLQACCAVTTEYGIHSNFVGKLTASLQIKI